MEIFGLTGQEQPYGRAIAADADTLRTMKRNLAVAENALRSGDHESAYAARRRLAEHFTSTDQLDVASLQRQQGLRIALASNIPALLADAYLHTGLLAELRRKPLPAEQRQAGTTACYVTRGCLCSYPVCGHHHRHVIPFVLPNTSLSLQRRRPASVAALVCRSTYNATADCQLMLLLSR